MPLDRKDIRDRATSFARDWRDEKSERAEAQTFWNEFLEVFGVKRRRVAVFEKAVGRLKYGDQTKHGRIDVLWPGVLLAEHKSARHDLDAAFLQASDYFAGLADRELPAYVIVSDFARIRLYDLEGKHEHEFALKELPKKIHLFGFIAGYRKQSVREHDPINIDAVGRVGELHDLLKRDGYGGHQLQVFLVRLLFCLFADDTGIFQPKDTFHDLIETFTSEDGGNVGEALDRLFVTLNTDVAARQTSLPERFAAFPYVNGRLFEERLAAPSFNREMRAMLLSLAELNWGAISPAIFGAMFQSVINHDAKQLRRQIGAHYTSEANILKVIGPLFLDDLRSEFQRIKSNKEKLFEFWKKLANLRILDPACGCGNFLVVSYRELRRLELDVLRAAEAFGSRIATVFEALKLDVDQFYGIEIEEFPAQVAQVAMWLMDHQMNLEAGEVFGEPVTRIPLIKSAHIRHANALEIDWAEFVPPTQLNYIVGNPPFVGKQYQTASQKIDMARVTAGMNGAGVLDYVAAWFIKAAHYLTDEPASFGAIPVAANPGRKRFKDVRFGKGECVMSDMFVDGADIEARARRAVKCAFVSTNSITQGEQVGVLWSWLLARGIHIHFAHRTFKWTNEAPGKAAVHCVVIGFGAFEAARKRLFEYEAVDGESHEVTAATINPYLVNAPEVALPNRRKSIWSVPPMIFGNMPNDGSNLLLSDAEKLELIAREPDAASWIKPFLSADEFINNVPRWCLWLIGLKPSELKKLPAIATRIAGVKTHRATSSREETRALAATPTLFGEIRQPQGRYVLVPRHSSQRRSFVPMGFFNSEVIVGDSNMFIPDATLLHFGILHSTMHNAWIRFVCGGSKVTTAIPRALSTTTSLGHR